MYCTGVTASVNAGTKYDILATSANDRRVYGIGILSSDNAAQAIKIYLANGSNTYQVGTVNIPAGSGTNGTATAVDIFASTMNEAIFQKTRDANGL